MSRSRTGSESIPSTVASRAVSGSEGSRALAWATRSASMGWAWSDIGGVFCVVKLVESVLAVIGAEPVLDPANGHRRRRVLFVHLHPAHRVLGVAVVGGGPAVHDEQGSQDE